MQVATPEPMIKAIDDAFDGGCRRAELRATSTPPSRARRAFTPPTADVYRFMRRMMTRDGRADAIMNALSRHAGR